MCGEDRDDPARHIETGCMMILSTHALNMCHQSTYAMVIAGRASHPIRLLL